MKKIFFVVAMVCPLLTFTSFDNNSENKIDKKTEFYAKNINKVMEIAEKYKSKYPNDYFMQKNLILSELENMYEVYEFRKSIGLLNE